MAHLDEVLKNKRDFERDWILASRFEHGDLEEVEKEDGSIVIKHYLTIETEDGKKTIRCLGDVCTFAEGEEPCYDSMAFLLEARKIATYWMAKYIEKREISSLTGDIDFASYWLARGKKVSRLAWDFQYLSSKHGMGGPPTAKIQLIIDVGHKHKGVYPWNPSPADLMADDYYVKEEKASYRECLRCGHSAYVDFRNRRVMCDECGARWSFNDYGKLAYR